MTKVSDNPFPSLLIVETDPSTISNPAAGRQRLIVDPADHALKRKTSAGSVVAIGGISVPAGGTTGQWLKKVSGTDFDTAWDDAPGGGGADLTNFRLASMTDDGSFATDELEYADDTAMSAIWTPHGTTVAPLLRRAGSSVYYLGSTADGQAMDLDATGFASEFEIAFLISGHNHQRDLPETPNHSMCGIHLLDTSGNGLALSMYDDGGNYRFVITNWNYTSTGETLAGSADTTWVDGRPYWWALRKQSQGGGNFKYRMSKSADGATWTHAFESSSIAASPATLAWAGWGKHHPSQAAHVQEFIHAYAYGAPDLGI